MNNWEIESPDGSIVITKVQMMKAHAVYDTLDWSQPPLLEYRNHPDGPASAMAGCLGAVLGWSEDETRDRYENGTYFAELVDAQLEARRLWDVHYAASLS